MDLRRIGHGLPVSGGIRGIACPTSTRSAHTFVWDAGGVEYGYDGWEDSDEIDPPAINGGLDEEGNMTGYHVAMDYAHDQIIVRIVRAQLDNPRWVQVTLNLGHDTERGWFVDAAQTTSDSWGVWSPRVYVN